jgi:hypothetical protein
MRDEQQPILCVGGTRDGEHVAAAGPILHVPVLQPMPDMSNYSSAYDPASTSTLMRDTYEIDFIRFADGQINFWRHKDLSPRQAFMLLFSNYIPRN